MAVSRKIVVEKRIIICWRCMDEFQMIWKPENNAMLGRGVKKLKDVSNFKYRKAAKSQMDVKSGKELPRCHQTKMLSNRLRLNPSKTQFI